MDSTYIIWFSSIEIPKPGQEGLIGLRVESATFLAVEDWAHDNTPEGYELRSIEKHYGTPSDLALQGEVDVSLR